MNNKPKWLPDLVLLSDCDGNWNNYLDVLYKFFTKDFVANTTKFRGIRISLKKHPIVDNKEATFWHLISMGRDEEERTPDFRRCERIRWPRPIIENHRDNALKIWNNLRGNETRVCIWFEKENYLVVLAERNGYLLLWTAYLVIRNHQKRKLQREYEEYINAKAAP